MTKRGTPGLDVGVGEIRGPEEHAIAFVLCGGRSRRMGRDKALLEFGGRPLIACAVDVLANAGLPVFVAGASIESREQLEAFAPVIPDFEPGLGPLGGVCSALEATRADRGVFVPVDAPLLPSGLIQRLLWGAQVTGAAVALASLNGFPQTFPSVVARRALPAMKRALGEGRLGCLAGFEAAALELGESVYAIPAEVLAQCGQVSHADALPAVRWFENLNSEQDVRAASRWQAGRVS